MLSTGVRLAGIVWELLVLAMPQKQPRRKRWTGEHAWTSGLLRASLATEKKGSVLEDQTHETPVDQYVTVQDSTTPKKQLELFLGGECTYIHFQLDTVLGVGSASSLANAPCSRPQPPCRPPAAYL